MTTASDSLFFLIYTHNYESCVHTDEYTKIIIACVNRTPDTDSHEKLDILN